MREKLTNSRHCEPWAFFLGCGNHKMLGFLLFEQCPHCGVTCGDDEKFLGSDVGCSNHAKNNSNNKTINPLERKK